MCTVVQDGKDQTWKQYRKATEKDREQLRYPFPCTLVLLQIMSCCKHDATPWLASFRKQFAERLEVIAYPERERRRTVGIALGVLLHSVDLHGTVHLHADTMYQL